MVELRRWHNRGAPGCNGCTTDLLFFPDLPYSLAKLTTLGTLANFGISELFMNQKLMLCGQARYSIHLFDLHDLLNFYKGTERTDVPQVLQSQD